VIPPLPDHLPRPDDEEPLGVSFFRTFVGEGDDLSGLFLPHTFFGRSEINDAAFRNTDFTESNLCWNDFVDVDFTDAVLAGSDMRASLFQRVRFVRTDLRRADLRRSTFEGCAFEGALMEGAIVTQKQKAMMEFFRAFSPFQFEPPHVGCYGKAKAFGVTPSATATPISSSWSQGEPKLVRPDFGRCGDSYGLK
jgi:hypothetical protein